MAGITTVGIWKEKRLSGEASEAAQRLIPGAQIQDPPWPDDEWYRRTREQHRFGNWPALTPQILEFAKG